jgi:hypothetical protein
MWIAGFDNLTKCVVDKHEKWNWTKHPSISNFISVTSVKLSLRYMPPRNLFLASRSFCNGMYQRACHYLFLKSEKIPAMLYVGKGPESRTFRDIQGKAEDTDLKSWKDLGRSPIHKASPFCIYLPSRLLVGR